MAEKVFKRKYDSYHTVCLNHLTMIWYSNRKDWVPSCMLFKIPNSFPDTGRSSPVSTFSYVTFCELLMRWSRNYCDQGIVCLKSIDCIVNYIMLTEVLQYEGKFISNRFEKVFLWIVRIFWVRFMLNPTWAGLMGSWSS